MDTGTHLVIGLGLGGLAHIDPVVASDPTLATAVLIGVLLGSQAPDTDGLLRLKGNASYIKNHRGISHSIPALGIWTVLITLFVAAFFPGVPILHLTMWVLFAVCFHVFTDLFNAYGTQAVRPFSEKWISWYIIHIFDPVIFVTHIIALFMWSFQLARPEFIFTILYAFLAVYYVWRTLVYFAQLRSLPHKDIEYLKGDQYHLIPTVNLYVWNIVKQQVDGTYYLGELKKGTISWVDHVKCANHPAVTASKNHPDIASFLYFTDFACAEVREHSWGFEVRWIDVRYRHRKQYPFVAMLLMDRDYNALDSYIGWLSDSRLEKRMRLNTY